MPFEQAFQLCSLLLAGIAFGGLVLAHSVPLWLALVTSILLMTGLLRIWNISTVRRIFWPVAIPSYVRSFSVIAVFVLFVLDLAVISRELLPAGIHFLVMLLGIKLLSLQERRDYRQLYAISLMAMLASAALTTEVWYVLIFLLYLLAAVWTLLLYHWTNASGAMGTDQNAAGCLVSARISGHFFWLTNAMAIAVCCLTVSIFFLTPRMGVGMLQKPRGEGLKTTGFSERVDLGMMGSVKQDPRVVMRVELPELPNGTMDRLYLRGVAYDRYNGRSWSIGDARRRHLAGFGDGTFAVRPAGSRRTEHFANAIQQDILLETLDTPVLFAAPFADYVSGEFPALHADGMAALYLPSSPMSPVRYSVISREFRLVSGEQIAPALDYPPGIREQYLQTAGLSEKVVALSRQVVHPATTPYDQALAIQQHLLLRYRYSLDVETTTSLHPLEDFLLTRKTGYCEHYATAMVMMLRAVGIPARLITGFLATEWNEFGGYFTVRQRDAHAWVEVYFPQSGWITFDPTPASGAISSGSNMDALYRFAQSLRLHWDRLFIRYSARDQLAVVHGMRNSSEAVRDHLSQWIASVGRSLTHVFSHLTEWGSSARIFVTVCILIGLATTLLLLRKPGSSKRFPEGLAHRRQLHITRLYRNMLQAVAEKGLTKPSAATPTEFARLVTKEWAAASVIITGVTDLYCRGRFSITSLTKEELIHAENQVRLLLQLSRATL